MGKQSSRIYFQEKDHKDIWFQGNYHNAMYVGSQLVWKKLPVGKNIYLLGGRSEIADYNGKFGYTDHILFLRKKGFVSVFDGYIQYSNDLTAWVRLHEIEDGYYGMRFLNDDELYGVKSIAVNESKYETSVFRYSIKEDSYLEFKIDSDDKISNVSEFCSYSGYYCLQNNGSYGTGITLYKINKDGISTIEIPSNTTSGNVRIYRSGAIYAIDEKIYFIKQTGTRSGSNVLYSRKLFYYDENGEEKEVCDIESWTSRSWGENVPNKSLIYILDAENNKIFDDGYLITVSNDGKSATVKSFSLNVGFSINTYKNGLEEDNKITFNNKSYLISATDNAGKNNRLQDGELKRDCIVYSIARYVEETKEYEQYLVMIQEFFESDKNYAIKIG